VKRHKEEDEAGEETAIDKITVIKDMVATSDVVVSIYDDNNR